MSQSRPVPGISHQRHTIQPDHLSRIASPLAMPQQPPQASEQLHELAMHIYSDLAAEHIASGVPVDPGFLRQLARDAQTAARAYFESAEV